MRTAYEDEQESLEQGEEWTGLKPLILFLNQHLIQESCPLLQSPHCRFGGFTSAALTLSFVHSDL